MLLRAGSENHHLETPFGTVLEYSMIKIKPPRDPDSASIPTGKRQTVGLATHSSNETLKPSNGSQRGKNL